LNESGDIDIQNSKPNVVGEYLRKRFLHGREGGYTQQQLAQKIGVTRQTISHLVTGKRDLSAELAMRFAHAFVEPLKHWLDLKNANQDGLSLDRIQWQHNQTLVDKDIVDEIRTGNLTIDPFTEESVQPTGYDLRVGARVVVTSGDKDSELDLTSIGSFHLEPMSIAVIQTHERLSFSRSHFGRLGLTTFLSTHGIFVTHGLHVDPGFKGFLYFTLFNPTGSPFLLQHCQPFMTLEINRLFNGPDEVYTGPNLNREDFLPAERAIAGRTNSATPDRSEQPDTSEPTSPELMIEDQTLDAAIRIVQAALKQRKLI
jgi:dCTP deaminase